MADHGHDFHGGPEAPYDSELDLKRIVTFTVGVVVVTLIAAAIM